MPDWNIDEARATYAVRHWGGGYFDINGQGHVVVRPNRDPDRAGVDLFELVAEIQAQGLSLPTLVRFPGILRERVDGLCGAFAEAMARHGYRGRYTAVYPIKVNQHRSVVEELTRYGGTRVGLEAGSKPELMAVLALAPHGGTVVCNGYKDREYIRLALIGTALGHRVYVVIEKLSELELVLEESRKLGIVPSLGVRVRLASIGEGRWQNTGGEKAKFGLSAGQLLNTVERLRAAGSLSALTLLHFHMGSQISNARDIQRGIREAARVFTELRGLGVPLGTIDVGGGLGVDYEGTRSRSYFSINYGVHEYAHHIVQTVGEACEEAGLDHPDIFTESGRAMTAHHALLIANVIDVEDPPRGGELVAPRPDAPRILHSLWDGIERLSERAALEIFHDTAHYLQEAQEMCTHGVLTLAQRALAENIYFAVCDRLRPLLRPSVPAHREVLDELDEKLASKYFCNFSVFQSLPDVWGLHQVFPIMPLHRLDEAPTVRGILADLTCDSDGRVDAYVDKDGIQQTLLLHPRRGSEPYYLGFFLVGAYQEILGDMHNLFGDTDSVNVRESGDGAFSITEAIHGDTVDRVLAHVAFEGRALLRAYRRKVGAADLPAERRQALLLELEAAVSGGTYLEP
jgi:arginine decarboxylase